LSTEGTIAQLSMMKRLLLTASPKTDNFGKIVAANMRDIGLAICDIGQRAMDVEQQWFSCT
jgi:hypothetical protein